MAKTYVVLTTHTKYCEIAHKSKRIWSIKSATRRLLKCIVTGTIARFDPIKNHNMMINAFNEVLIYHQDAVLLVVGEGDERANIKKLISLKV